MLLELFLAKFILWRHWVVRRQDGATSRCIPGPTKICVTYLYNAGGTRWRSWLWHCATNMKVVGSILDGLIRIFH